MTTRELLEMASLDALGLLDEQEREEFERAFRAAPPEVRAQLRKEQARFADIDRWLPAVEPPPGLRARVVSAVKEAIAAVSEPAPATAGRIGPLAMPRWWNTAPLWRAACIGFATASVVLAGFFVRISQEYQRLDRITGSNIESDPFRKDGHGQLPSILVSANQHNVDFQLASAAFGSQPAKTKAKLYYDSETRRAVLVCNDLPAESGQYALVLTNEAGQPERVLVEFESVAGYKYVSLAMESRDGADPLAMLSRLAIIGPATVGGSDQVILTARTA